MKFFKYSGNGNDFIILDGPQLIPGKAQIQKVCDRHFGVGADGVLILTSSPGVDGMMRIFNADGGEAEMCANGLRCLFTYLDHKSSSSKDSYSIRTMNGKYVAHRNGKSFAVEMSEVKDHNLHKIPAPGFERSFYVNTGVPHFVLLGKDIRSLLIADAVRPYRFHSLFPQGANIGLVETLSLEKQEAYVRTFERGVEDETYSCGTGLTAAAIALGHWFQWKGMITLFTKGGKQQVVLGDKILYSGEVTFCFSGEVEL